MTPLSLNITILEIVVILKLGHIFFILFFPNVLLFNVRLYFTLVNININTYCYAKHIIYKINEDNFKKNNSHGNLLRLLKISYIICKK